MSRHPLAQPDQFPSPLSFDEPDSPSATGFKPRHLSHANVTMPFSWQQMSQEDFAAFVGLLGPRITQAGDMYWGEVRRFFYRPLLPLREFKPGTIRTPLLATVGGAQYAVSPGADANSCLNWLVFDQTRDYSTAKLDKNRRRQVKLAAREFVIRRMTDLEEFKRQAHPVYLSFQNRTGYKVGANRRDPARFAAWAEAVFSVPNVLVLGGYREGELGGVSLTYRVGSTIFYATFFCNDDALERYLSDLMLHTVRESAAAAPEVTHVYAGMFKGSRGLDDFYLHRGAKLLRQPARLEINPLARVLLQKFMPKQFDQLLGNLTAEQMDQAGAAPARSI
jgi:hypothetical protein